MVIEHAERFGLAQLISCVAVSGAARAKSACLLLYAQPLGRDRQGEARHHARDRGRVPHRRGGPAAARRRELLAPARAACRTCGWPTSPLTPNCCQAARDDAGWSSARSRLQSERERRCAPALLFRAPML